MVIIERDMTCPGCKSENNRAAAGAGRGPKSGDLSVCWHCGYLSAFDEKLKLRHLTQAEYDSLDPEFWESLNKSRLSAGPEAAAGPMTAALERNDRGA